MMETRRAATIGIGLQYGDEGKIKVFDKVIGNSADIWVRFNGGPNAGHQLQTEHGSIITHQVPAGIFYQRALLYIGSGCVLNPEKLNKEIQEIEALGFPLTQRLKISPYATVIQPHHIILDRKEGKEVGTTGNGIGQAYASQALRQQGALLKNIRIGDYLGNPEHFKEIILANLHQALPQESIEQDHQQLVEMFHHQALQLVPYLCQDSCFLEKLAQQGKTIFMEGANAAMLDAITGDVPFVTSSRTLAAAAYLGGDLSPRYHAKTIGVAKAIMSRVGNGPFISEFGGKRLEDYCNEEGGYKYTKDQEEKLYDPQQLLATGDFFQLGIALRMLGNEYGSTTKRPRRIGMLDLVMLRQNCLLNGVDEWYLTKFDCLSQFSRSSLPGIPLVTGYELDGKMIGHLPLTTEERRRAKPIITYKKHIPRDISLDIPSSRARSGLPPEARDILRFIESFVGVPLKGIGVGPGREDFMFLGKH